MSKLEFKFSSGQPHQLEAIEATCNLFRDQRFSRGFFSIGSEVSLQGVLNDIILGQSNELQVAPGRLLENLHAVQEDNCLPPSNVLTDGRLRDFTIEMETGTGKTYVYIRTIYELNKRYGLTKFLIVVPSVAIREGVLKSFQTMRSHLDSLYDHVPLEYFVYDSKDMGQVGSFATSSSIQVMIINIDAFNKGLEEDGTAKDGNLFHRRSEKLIGGYSPQELVSACNPVVIIDEPQSVDNTKQAKSAIKSLHPLFVLRYSATHKQSYNMIYRLTPVDAFERQLVKSICVDSVTTQTNLNGAYIRLDSVKPSPYSAQLTIDVRQRDGSQKRKSVTLKPGSDLFIKSGENTDYKAGWIIRNIETCPGEEFVEFQNGTQLGLRETIGDVNVEIIKRAQIRRTIDDHLARQFNLWKRGVKVLSLFFIDRVDRYRIYEPEVHSGLYAQIFEDEYASALVSKAPRPIAIAAGLTQGTWLECYKAIGAQLVEDPRAVHQGYFAQDKKGKFKDSKGKASTRDDEGAFELIMQKKETLVSFPDGSDRDTEVSFIFSHSALKEGWDNPNVFQICTLVETKDSMSKRQKIGRGLRLCVNQEGERLRDPEANILTVIANESYDNFARGLQKELEEEDFKFGIITPETFTRVTLKNSEGIEERLGYAKSKILFEFLAQADLIDKKGAISPELKSSVENGSLILPEQFSQAKGEIEEIILHKSQKLQVRNKRDEITVEIVDEVIEDDAFQELWNRIRQRTRFTVDIDSGQLIQKAIALINDMPRIDPPTVTSERATLTVDETGVTTTATATSTMPLSGGISYDLPDPIAELQDAVGLTRKTLKAILEGCSRFTDFAIDPATFLSQVTRKIQSAKSDLMSEGITYELLPESEWYTKEVLLAFNGFTAFLDQNAWKPRTIGKSLYSYVVYDSAGVERRFADALDKHEEVLVYTKLPPSFTIDTPLGSYNPDWAYVEENNGERRLYFVIETKGGSDGEPTMRPSEKLKTDCARKHFAALDVGKDFQFEIRTDY